ncbi:polysaccharide biosynthesis tyrosine autokinase [Mycolicibacterium pallens]|uniref:non-specific protein-tyrosine kinase n=1 Tax=Mycolicibacterium pallens TaxID=370524 RepID=A0ABX8VJA1_9MYCO|nr:polysaccharide biosynthesis tyrosine autokinase [Mycolicibacterium pallens]APE16667.1 protein tyrosine kinase [Mycobacterium sp. WY10]QYL17876.1 polysaccharide biosynthesis tyrosine autokinase [Mycolicibacterium pallens]
MNIRDFAKLLRTRWITVCVTTLAVVLGAVLYTLLTTPLYQASTRLFVSASSGGASVSDLYQGNLFSQQRVLSYAELLGGGTVAQRTIDKLKLDTTADALEKRIKATVKPNTVLIDVSVLDESPVRARDIANALSDEFVALVGELETTTPGAQADSRVVVEQRASVPTKPLVPNPVRNIGIGLGLGVLLGVGLAVLRDMLDNTIKSQQTLEEIAGSSVVGYIPLDKDIRKVPALSFVSDNSGTAEAFRKLRTNLQFLAVDNPPRVIVVTSSSPAEGKSTTAINIALALAEAEHNVVLVDGDMRRPSLDKYLDLVGSVGFSTVLSGTASLAEVLQKTEFPRLTVLTAGSIPPNPSELLGSLAARKVLDELRAQFDFVVVDSSPLLAVTDGAVLAATADGALIVARFGKTKRDHLAHAVENLNSVGASVLGAVMTMMPARGGSSYSYHYSYGGSSGDGNRDQRKEPANFHSADAETNRPDVNTTADATSPRHLTERKDGDASPVKRSLD